MNFAAVLAFDVYGLARTVLRYWLNELTAPSDARLDLTCTLSVDGVSLLYGVSCSLSFAAYSPETTASAWFSSDFGRRVAPPVSLFFVLSALPSVHGDAAAHVFLVIGRVHISVGDFEALHCDVFGVLQQDGLADARTGDDGRGAFAVRSDGDGRVLGAFGVDVAQAGLDRVAVDGLGRAGAGGAGLEQQGLTGFEGDAVRRCQRVERGWLGFRTLRTPILAANHSH